jgi:hypothetical protein
MQAKIVLPLSPELSRRLYVQSQSAVNATHNWYLRRNCV